MDHIQQRVQIKSNQIIDLYRSSSETCLWRYLSPAVKKNTLIWWMNAWKKNVHAFKSHINGDHFRISEWWPPYKSITKIQPKVMNESPTHYILTLHKQNEKKKYNFWTAIDIRTPIHRNTTTKRRNQPFQCFRNSIEKL